MSTVLLSIESLRIAAGEKLLCDGLSLEARSGEFWCVIGRNGAGKSTLLHTLAGLLNPQSGRILIEGAELSTLRPEVLATRRGLLAQQQYDAFSSTVLETVMAGRHPYQIGMAWEDRDDRAIATWALGAVGLEHSAGKDVMKLSGGERQRVALATLLAQNPDLLLLDEPTAHQDAAAQLAVMGLARELVERDPVSAGRGKAVIAACHDINLVSRFATHVLALAEGRHWSGPTETVLIPSVLQQVFGCRFEVVEAEQGRLFVPLAEQKLA
ncbi:MAG TPA: ABC transporter ATP-binding protein [Noviherbaspirillum sp.]|nr:ABC transporter ATP-binding protein [Noviherbaspirillum sp.]